MVGSKRRAGKRQTKEITIQLAWDQAPHRGEEEKKIDVGKKKKIGEQSEPKGSLLRSLRHPFPLPRQPQPQPHFSYRTPFFAFFSPPADPGPTLPFSQGCTPLLSSISVLCHVNVQRAYFLFSSDYKDVSTSYPQLLYSPPYNLLFYFLYPFFPHVPFVSNLNRYALGIL